MYLSELTPSSTVFSFGAACGLEGWDTARVIALAISQSPSPDQRFDTLMQIGAELVADHQSYLAVLQRARASASRDLVDRVQGSSFHWSLSRVLAI